MEKVKPMLPEFLTDCCISQAPLTAVLDVATIRGVLWQATPEQLLLDVPGVARYLAKGGKSITVDPAPDAPAERVSYFLGMLPLAALSYQRGMLAFHAAAVCNDKGALLLAGDSGSGKSTLLAALLKRGWRMLADDLAIVGLDKQGQPVVFPSAQGIALWPESLKKLAIDPGGLQSCDTNRYIFVPAERASGNPVPLRCMYRLGIHSKSGVEQEEPSGNARFRLIATMLYNSHVADAVCNKADYLRCAAAISRQAPIRILRRPRGQWSVEMLAEHISL